MRTHRAHRTIAPWSVGTPVLDAARLVAVRVEPVLRGRAAMFAVDAVLEDGDRLTVIPLALAEPAGVLARERDALVWPDAFPGDDAFAVALSEPIVAHLSGLVARGAPVAEHVVRRAPSPRFERARERGCFGAAPLSVSLAALAPYRYARRFARGRALRLAAPAAVGGWMLLKDVALPGVADGWADEAESAWYGAAPAAGGRTDLAVLSAGEEAANAPVIVRIGGTTGTLVAATVPQPLDISFSFDPAEGPAATTFALERTPEPSLRAVAGAVDAAGGSSGRIAVALARADALLRPSADTDEALALVAGLQAEGIDAVLARDPRALPDVDLVHLVGARDGTRAQAFLEAARRAGVPLAVQAHDEDAADGGWWGVEVTRCCFEYGDDDAAVRAYLAMLAAGTVSLGDVRADLRYAPAGVALEATDTVLRDADLVLANTAGEAEVMRARTGRRASIAVVPPLARAAASEPVGALVGTDPFAFVHAPIGPLANQLLVARAAADAGIPLVLAGPVADAAYLERTREAGGLGLIALPEPSPGEAAALRAAAAVVVDAAWIGDGASRLAAAALAGARLALATRRRFEVPGITPRRAAPNDLGALTRALGEAWDEALRAPGAVRPETAGALAPAAAVRAILSAYATLAVSA